MCKMGKWPTSLSTSGEYQSFCMGKKNCIGFDKSVLFYNFASGRITLKNEFYEK